MAKQKYTIEDIDTAHRDGYKEGLIHAEPSPKTVEEVTNLKINMEGMKKDIQYIKDAVDKTVQTMESFISGCECKFAAKTVEEDLASLKTELNKRDYEWLKWMIVTLATVLITVFIYNKFHL